MTSQSINSYDGLPVFYPIVEGMDWDNITLDQALDVKSACYEVMVNGPSQIKAIASILYAAGDSSVGLREEDITQISLTIHHLTQLVDDAIQYDILAENWLNFLAPSDYLVQFIDCMDDDKEKIKEAIDKAVAKKRAIKEAYAEMTEEETEQAAELLRTMLSMENLTQEAAEEAFPDFPKETAAKLLKLLEAHDGAPAEA